MQLLNQTGRYCIWGLTLIAMGCGGGVEKVNLASATGQVTDGEKPIAGAVIEFFPTDGRTSVGVTDGDGKFTLKYNDELGAVVGEGKIQVTPGSPQAAGPGEGDVVAPPMEGPPKIVRLKEVWTIKEGEENHFDIDMSKYTE